MGRHRTGDPFPGPWRSSADRAVVRCRSGRRSHRATGRRPSLPALDPELVFGLAGPVRSSFDEPATALSQVTFCVVDLETTGGDAGRCAITEVGAVKVRGGEVLGTFQTLIDPGVAIPPMVSTLTGLTDAMVHRAPRMAQALPSLLEFIGGAVIVGHNVRFDLAFLQAALHRWDGAALGNVGVDTLALSRRLLADEVPDHRLATLAERLDLSHRPTHRALADAWATCDLLHALIERATAWGVHALDDLVALPQLAGHRHWRKLSLTAELPRWPGVYEFTDRAGHVIHTGVAADLRTEVRGYFAADRPARTGQLLRDLHRIRHHVCVSPLEAAVRERRLRRSVGPPSGRARRSGQPVYVRLTEERFPRLTVSRTPSPSAAHVGPLPDRGAARSVIEAILAAVPLRRCTERIGRSAPRPPVGGPCPAAPATTGSWGAGSTAAGAGCPCRGTVSDADYRRRVDTVRRGLAGEPQLLLGAVEQRMHRLAGQGRFEEAGVVRDLGAVLERALRPRRQAERFAVAERLVIELPDGVVVDLGPDGALGDLGPLDPEERAWVAGWLDRYAGHVRLRRVEGAWCSPLPPFPSFTPTGRAPTPGRAVSRSTS